MSNRRKSRTTRYHTGYLRSPVWFARRSRWFTTQLDEHGLVSCVACGISTRPRELELHHVDYTGVVVRHGRWIAGETDDDLIPLHPRCHELLHRLMDRDPVLARHRTRRDATDIALLTLTHALQACTNREPS